MIIYPILSAVLSIIAASILIIFVKKEKTLNVMAKICAFLVFAIVGTKLLLRSTDLSESPDMKDVFFTATYSIITGRYEGVFDSRISSLLYLIFKMFTNITIGTMFVGLIIDSKGIRIYNLFVLPIVIVLDIVLFKTNIYAIVGNYEMRKTLQSIVLLLTIVIFSLSYGVFIKRELMYKNKNRYGKEAVLVALMIFIPLLIMYLPIYSLSNLFGEYGSYSKEFNTSHIILLVITVLCYIIPVLVLKNRSEEEKKVFILLYAFSAFFQYFSRYCYFGMPLDIYPIHICNTAVILMLIATIFNIKSVFFFTYFCNTMGALFAILMPNDGDLFEAGTLEFWYNHIVDFTLPYIAVTIGIFKKPSFKNMVSAIGIFTIYVILVQLAGAYCNAGINPQDNVWNTDFFFLYGDKFTGISFVKKFAWNLKFKLNSDGNLKYVLYFNLAGKQVFMYWLNTLVIYASFIGFAFVGWYLVDRLEQVVADIKLTNYKKKIKLEKIGKTSKEEVEEIKNKMGGKTMVKITHFSKKYASSNKYSVKDFNLEINDGDVFGFIGHNGAGKSTVIKSLVGIQSITEGTIEISGYDIEKYPLQAKLNIGYVSDNHAVYEKLTGREYINYVAELYQVPKKEREERIEYYTKMFGLTDALDKEAKGYSHGMKQKLVVIASLIHNPKVWVLDEPLTGLDPTSAYEIKECMREHASKGNIVFFSTHVIEVIEKICNKIAIISHGELMGVYDIKELKEQGISLESLYLKYVVSNEKKNRFTEEDIKTTDAGLILEKNND